MLSTYDIMMALEHDRIRGILRLASEATECEKTMNSLMSFIKLVDNGYVSGNLREFAVKRLKRLLNIYGVIQ